MPVLNPFTTLPVSLPLLFKKNKSMQKSGNIRKMRTQLDKPVQYTLPLYDNLEEGAFVEMTPLVGKEIRLAFNNQINCVVTGKKIKKTFGEGMSYPAFKTSTWAVESIIRPELSRAHLGEALRDLEWEKEHDLQPHFVYLALTNHVKVGVTRQGHLPGRWIDQGAWKAIVLAETPYRYLAGVIEKGLKAHMSDKTQWQRMLKNERLDLDLLEEKQRIGKLLPAKHQQYISSDDSITEIEYPVEQYPDKVKSMKLDKVPEIEKRLTGIRGQYFLFEDNTVINIRSHAGYHVTVEY